MCPRLDSNQHILANAATWTQCVYQFRHLGLLLMQLLLHFCKYRKQNGICKSQVKNCVIRWAISVNKPNNNKREGLPDFKFHALKGCIQIVAVLFQLCVSSRHPHIPSLHIPSPQYLVTPSGDGNCCIPHIPSLHISSPLQGMGAAVLYSITTPNFVHKL